MGKRRWAAALAAVLCLCLLTGCGGERGAGSTAGAGDAVGGSTLGKDSGDNLLLCMSADNQWVLSKAEEGAASAVLGKVYADRKTLDSSPVSAEFVPGLNRSCPSLVWFTPDGKSVYFCSEYDGFCANLYHLDRSALKKDFSNAAECVTLLSENISVSINNQLVDNGLLYRTEDGALYYSTGVDAVLLDRDVIFLYSRDELPSDGGAAFALADGRRAVVYPVQTEDGIQLCTRPVNGDGDVTTLGSGIKSYYCDVDSNHVFFVSEDGIYHTTLSGESTCLAGPGGSILSTDGGTAYYLSPAEDSRCVLYCYDGGESRTICDSVTSGWIHYACADAKNRIALYVDSADGKFYCSIDNERESTFELSEESSGWEYCGILDGGKEIAVCGTGGRREAVILSVSGKEVADAKTIAADCRNPRIRGNSDFCLFTNAAGDAGKADVALYRGGTLTTLAEGVNCQDTSHYSDDVLLTLRDQALLQFQEGDETHVANNAAYYLRIGDGKILYTSDDNTLSLYNGKESVRLLEGVVSMFCANGEYSSGAASASYPEFYP